MNRPVIIWNFGGMQAGGGRVVGQEFLRWLSEDQSFKHVCIADRNLLDSARVPASIDVIPICTPNWKRRLDADQRFVPALIRTHRANALITLGNTGTWCAPVPHGVFVQNAYLAFRLRDVKGVRMRGWVKTGLLRSYFKPTVATAQSFVVQTEAMSAAFCRLWRVQPGRVRVIRGALSTSFCDALKSGGAVDRHQPTYLVTISDDGPHKNLDLIPRVAAVLARRGRPLEFRVTIPKDSDGAQRLRAKALRLGVERYVRFEGILGEKRLVALLGGAAAAFQPSLLESLGLPYIEATAVGIPVIAVDQPVAREVCGKHGIYFGSHDAESAADAVESALAVPRLVAKLGSGGEPGAEMVKQFVAWAGALARAGT